MSNQASAGAGPLSNLYCPRCGFPLYQIDRFCGRCDLPLAQAPPGSRPFAPAPGIHDPQKKCWNCPATMLPDRSYCTFCGADLSRAPILVPRPKKQSRQFRNPPLAVSLFGLAVQIPLLALLYWVYSHNRSIPNLIFVTGIAVTGVVNVMTAIRLAVASIRRKHRR